MTTDVERLAESVRRVLLQAIGEGTLGPGAAGDIGRRMADDAGARGVPLDDLLALARFGERG